MLFMQHKNRLIYPQLNLVAITSLSTVHGAADWLLLHQQPMSCGSTFKCY